MRARDSFMAWFGPMVLIGVFVWTLFGNATSHDLLCGASKSCFRDWVFGMSGWAAAAAAALTIGSLFKQANAQQRQTDFQLGDALPTFDAVQHRDHGRRVMIRIRNWNRRSMILRRIRLVGHDEISMIYVSLDPENGQSMSPFGTKRNWTVGRGTEIIFEPAILLEGWVLREKEPPLLKFGILAVTGPKEYLEEEWHDVPIEIQYELVGVRQISTISAHVHLAAASFESLWDEQIVPNRTDVAE